MTRIAAAAMLAVPFLLAGGGSVRANGPISAFGLGCGSTALNFLPHIHQHGPLFNYGPYYGYPPFEPYGNWNAYLQYTGPTDPNAYGGGGGGAYGFIGNNHPHTWGNGHGRPGTARGGLFHPKGHGGEASYTPSAGCASCGAAAANYLHAGPVAGRYTGVGDPAASAAFYAGTPSLVVPVSYPGR